MGCPVGEMPDEKTPHGEGRPVEETPHGDVSTVF